MWEISLEGEKEYKYAAVPENIYKLVVENVEMKTGKTSGENYFEWTFSIAEGPYAGTMIKSITTLKKGKRWHLRNLLTSIGIPAKDEKISFSLEQVADKEVMGKVTLKTEKYFLNGKEKEKEKNSIKEFSQVSVEEIPF